MTTKEKILCKCGHGHWNKQGGCSCCPCKEYKPVESLPVEAKEKNRLTYEETKQRFGLPVAERKPTLSTPSEPDLLDKPSDSIKYPSSMAVEEKEAPSGGTWPSVCVQRAFVEGMKWWGWQRHRATAFRSEIDEAEAEAVKRYGEPQPDSSFRAIERQSRTIAALHASLIDLIDRTLSCTSGFSHLECLEEIKRRLEK